MNTQTTTYVVAGWTPIFTHEDVFGPFETYAEADAWSRDLARTHHNVTIRRNGQLSPDAGCRDSWLRGYVAALQSVQGETPTNESDLWLRAAEAWHIRTVERANT